MIKYGLEINLSPEHSKEVEDMENAERHHNRQELMNLADRESAKFRSALSRN
jgi:hypothetical protein